GESGWPCSRSSPPGPTGKAGRSTWSPPIRPTPRGTGVLASRDKRNSRPRTIRTSSARCGASPASAVEPGEHPALGLVEARELCVEAVVRAAVPGVGPEGPLDLDQLADLLAANRAQRNRRHQRCAAQVGMERLGDALDGAIHDVGVDLAPEIGDGAP